MTSVQDIARTGPASSFSPVLYISGTTDIFQVDVCEFAGRRELNDDTEICGELFARVPIDFLRGLRHATDFNEAWSDPCGHSIIPIDDKVEIILVGRGGSVYIDVARKSNSWLASRFEYALRHMDEGVPCGEEGCPITLTASWE